VAIICVFGQAWKVVSSSLSRCNAKLAKSFKHSPARLYFPQVYKRRCTVRLS
jgi:hypothetical protein